MPVPRVNPLSSIDEDRIIRLQHYGPVTSLKIYGNHILAGYGPTLKVFKVDKDSSTTKIVFSKQIFKRNKIHNIEFNKCGDKVVLAGARSFIILDFVSIISGQSLKIDEKAINEWIVSVGFQNDSCLLLLNSHNTIYQIDINSFEFIDKIDCNEKSILYSGSIRILNNGKIYIAAGTVMNGVIVWDLHTRKILYNLKHHEGSIFGVQIDESGKFLVSCSDDRSVKLYDFETGNLLSTGWGHASRIWVLKFFKDKTSVKILSAGEDCTIRVWKYEEGNDLLIQTDLYENVHSGKHIWSLDLDDEYLQLSVSGGSDGKIRLHNMTESKIIDTYPIEIIEDQTKTKFSKNECIKQIVELHQLNLLVLLTSHGNIFGLNLNTNQFYKIHLDTEEMNKFLNFGIMKGFADVNTVVISTRKGDLLILQFSESVQPGKYWIQDRFLNGNMVTNVLTESDGKSYYVLLDSPNPKIPFILHEFTYNGSFELKKTLKLDQPNQAFTTTTMVLDKVNKWLILGSRYVSIAIYDLKNDNETIPLDSIHKKLSLGDAITSISIIRSFVGSCNLLVTVRDGVYMILKLLKQLNEVSTIEVLLQNKISRGFIEGGYMHGGDLIIIGFRSSSFYIWNETKQIEIATELCGGSHRLWELFRYKLDTEFKFVYIKKSTLHLCKFTDRFGKQNHGLMNTGTHGREIRDVTISPQIHGNSKYIMTASEDATVRLSKLDNHGNIHNYWSMNAHVSGLQKIKFIDGTYIASSAANEEFIIWKLDHIDFESPLLRVFTKLAPSSDIPDLRIMDFDVIKLENTFIIVTAYSDSNIKLWSFDFKTKQFKKLQSFYYSTCCIFNTKFLRFDSFTYLLITASDGHTCIFDFSDLNDQDKSQPIIGSLLIKQQLHQSGIKAVLLEKNNTGYDLFTGGDDNALIHSTLKLVDGKLVLNIISFIEEAASSSITSICKGNENSVVVTSVDQILREWEYSDSHLKCTSATYTTIADTGCSDSTILDNSRYIVVGGSGLSTFKLQT